jgi:hypothetical protein
LELDVFVGSAFGSYLFEIWVDEIGTEVFEGLPMRDFVLLNANSVHFSVLLLAVHNVRKELAFTYKRIIVVHNLK